MLQSMVCFKHDVGFTKQEAGFSSSTRGKVVLRMTMALRMGVLGRPGSHHSLEFHIRLVRTWLEE